MKMKDTLNLGKTKFPMRGNLPVKEVERQKQWKEDRVYEKRQEQNQDKTPFILHDGPPYANGNIHIGHAMNKISKDIIIRSRSMSGYRAPYVPGWDTHGLPIEQAVTNSGVDRKKLSLAQFRKVCQEYAEKQVDGQRNDFKRLGVAGDWENPYLTFQPEYEEYQIRLFGKMADDGLIYRGLKPVYWSPSSESTLAEAEVEYHDIESPSIYYAQKVIKTPTDLPKGTEFIVWTTTPWTVPASMAVTVNPDFDYALVHTGEHHYVVLANLVPDLAERLQWENYTVEKTYKGKELEYTELQHPFYDRHLLTILGDFVSADTGTGMVHTAPGHGEDDYFASLKYNIDVLSPIDDQGRYTDEAPGLEGIFYEEGNDKVIEVLKEKHALLRLDYFTHSYPHDWRTKKPVIFRATPQWFCSVEKIRERTLDVIENEVKWWHPSGERRIYNMIKERGDWVISRQRVWGVPLPIFYAEDHTPIITSETIDYVAKLIGQYGSNVWFEREAKDLLPEGFTHPGSPNGIFTKETDIMDVWFDSGSSHAGVLKARKELVFPADLYLEGSDQYRGWFNSSLLTSVAVNDIAPYKGVVSQGFVNDGEGRKMSKSIGNTVSPNDVCKQRGADILRLWVTAVDTRYDVRISDDILAQVAESYRKIRNTMRFMLGNVSDFDVKNDAVPYENLASIDQYMMNELNTLVKDVREAYERYDFNEINHRIINFLTLQMSSFYLDYAKDVVYIELADDPRRRNMQTVMYAVLKNITILLTPILPHTMEEIWQYLQEEAEYAQLADFEEVKVYPNTEVLYALWPKFLSFRDEVNKTLEEARNNKIIGKSLEAKLHIYPNAEVAEMLHQVGAELNTYLIISQSMLHENEQAPETASHYDGFSLTVEHALGNTCERCRGVYESVGTLKEAPSLCTRCAEIVLHHFPEALKVEEE